MERKDASLLWTSALGSLLFGVRQVNVCTRSGGCLTTHAVDFALRAEIRLSSAPQSSQMVSTRGKLR